MHTIKGFFGWAVMLTGICTTFADELAVTPLTPVEAPARATNSQIQRISYGVVGVSGTNAVFVWNGSGYGKNPLTNISGGWTNLYLNELGPSGGPAGDMKFMATTIRTPGAPRLLAADNGFFALFKRQSEFVFTRLNKSGDSILAPVTIITNTFKTYAAASNGKTVLLLYEGGYPATVALEYMLLDHNGGITSTGLITGAVEHQYAVSSDGTNYLAVWQATETLALRGTLFSGQDGSTSAFNVDTNATSILSLGHGTAGYLLATTNELLQIREDGVALRKAAYSASAGQRTVIYGEDDGWGIFSLSYTVDSAHVRPSDMGLDLGVGHYPSTPFTSTAAYPTPTPPIENLVVPFGKGRYLIAQDQGTTLLTTNGYGGLMKPTTYRGQNHQKVAASPSGYLIVWQEPNTRIRGLRLNKDGTSIDSHSFLIEDSGTFGIQSNMACVFDGTDYTVGWFRGGANGVFARLARISPLGNPNIRLQDLNALTRSTTPINLIEHKGTLYVWQEFTDVQPPNVHVMAVDSSGNLGTAVDVPGQSVVSDGASLYALGVKDFSTAYLQRFDPLGTPVQGNVIEIGFVTSPVGISGPRGLAVYWDGAYAYFTNGVERWSGSLPYAYSHQLALNDSRLLIGEIYNSGVGSKFVFRTVNLNTGKTNVVESDLGGAYQLDFASSGRDFLGVTSTQGMLSYSYVGKFWVTDAKAPTFGALNGSESGIDATLTLNPGRHYRIESSEDLVNWNLEDEITGVSEHAVTNSGGQKGFIRAVLIVE